MKAMSEACIKALFFTYFPPRRLIQTMKRPFLLISTLLCTMFVQAVHADETIVTTADELRTALNNSTATIHIATDIDLTDASWSIASFSGTLEAKMRTGETQSVAVDKNGQTVRDGNGNPVNLPCHRITGMTSSLFTQLNGATISDIYFDGASYAAGGLATDLNGLLADEAVNTFFKDLCFNRCTVTNGNAGSGGNFVGLVAGNASDCTFTNIDVTACRIAPEGIDVGALVGKASGCTFTACHTDTQTSVSGEGMSNARVGGLCGWAAKSETDRTSCSFKECTNNAQVSTSNSSDEAGGICGYAEGGTFEYCVNNGDIICLDDYAGGIVGLAESITTIHHCLNTGNVMGDEQAGGIVGRLSGTNSTVENCLNTGSVFATKDSGPIYGDLHDTGSAAYNYTIGHEAREFYDELATVTREGLASGQVASDMNTRLGNSIWHQKVGTDPVPVPLATDGRPVVGDEGNAIDANVNCWVTVNSLDELKNAIRDRWAWIKINADITLPHDVYGLSTYEFPFHGKIDGQGHTISGLYHDQGIELEDHAFANIGLLNYAEGALIQNLKLDNVHFVGSYHVGALVANSKGCTFTNIRFGKSDNGATESYVATGGYYVGCLVGVSEDDLFEDCVTEGMNDRTAVHGDGFSTSPDANAGGIAGGASGSTFRRCINNVQVGAKDDRVGGIVGKAERCTFEGCINNGHILHWTTTFNMEDELGGIAGYAGHCTFSTCTNTGLCSGNDAYIGGIVGYACDQTAISNCLNTASVRGGEQVGAIVGFFKQSTLRNCLNVGSPSLRVDNNYVEVTGWNELFGEAGTEAHWTNNYIRHSSYDRGSGGRALVTDEQLASGQVAWWLNESKESDSSIWRQNITGTDTDAWPVLDANHDEVTSGSFTNIFIIHDESDLRAFTYQVNEGDGSALWAVLDADITLPDPASGESTNWIPIGKATWSGDGLDLSHAYSGTFMGNGHTVSNIRVSAQSGHIGFFGTVTAGAVITDLIVDGELTIASEDYSGVGGIVGAAESKNAGTVQILRCGNKAAVSTGKNNAGGIIGGVYSCDGLELIVTDCWNTGAVTGKESAALCGNFKDKATFTNCWNTGTLSTLADTDNYPFARPGNVGKYGTFVNCYQLSTNDLNDQTSVKTFTEEELLNGHLCYLLNGKHVTGDNLVWEQNIGVDAQPLFGERGVRHTRTMNNPYGTVCLPFAVSSDDDVQFYTLTSTSGDALVFTPTPTVAAGVPCLARRMSNDTEVALMPADTTTCWSPKTVDPVNGYKPVGTFTNVENQTGIYYIAAGQFWYAVDAITIPAFRAWFESGNNAGEALAIRIGDATGIWNENEDEYENGGEGIYDLSGRLMSDETPLAPGIYIIGGKKVLVR